MSFSAFAAGVVSILFGFLTLYVGGTLIQVRAIANTFLVVNLRTWQSHNLEYEHNT